MTKESITTDWGQVGCTIRGSGGVPLIFLHGVGSDRSVWAQQLSLFGQARMTIALDLPGYGNSEAGPARGESRREFAESALSVLEALEIKHAHVCGLSLGGVIAISMASLAPKRIESLVLADTFARHPEGSAILARSLAGVDALGMAGLAESRADALLAKPATSEVRRAVVETMARIDPAAYLRAARVVWSADQRREAAAITQPTMILYGSEDRITPPALSEELKVLIPHAALIEIAAAGHLPNLEQPATFNRVLTAFLSDVEKGF
jgi:3-oxoadipate enol-lactonase